MSVEFIFISPMDTIDGFKNGPHNFKDSFIDSSDLFYRSGNRNVDLYFSWLESLSSLCKNYIEN